MIALENIFVCLSTRRLWNLTSIHDAVASGSVLGKDT